MKLDKEYGVFGIYLAVGLLALGLHLGLPQAADAKPRLYDVGCVESYLRVHQVLQWSPDYGHDWLRGKLGNCEVR